MLVWEEAPGPITAITRGAVSTPERGPEAGQKKLLLLFLFHYGHFSMLKDLNDQRSVNKFHLAHLIDDLVEE